MCNGVRHTILLTSPAGLGLLTCVIIPNIRPGGAHAESFPITGELLSLSCYNIIVVTNCLYAIQNQTFFFLNDMNKTVGEKI